jgi:hypothetical protein
MKRLIAFATLSLALSFSSATFASDFMSLYTKPIVRSEARNEIKGGNVESGFTSFYTTPKSTNTTVSPLTSSQGSYDEYVSAFGVRITK